MISLDPRSVAAAANPAAPSRPATQVLLDTPDVRLVVFRLLDGQEVTPHRSTSSVLLTVLRGEGTLSGPDDERHCREGDMVSWQPNELHGMRATAGELHLLATITPRPGERAAAAPHSPHGVR